MTPLPPSQGVPRERTQAQHGGRAGAGGCSPSSSRINGVDPRGGGLFILFFIFR